MYQKTDLFERQQLKDERKRMETKKELKSLLTKYIGPERAKYQVDNAQHKIGVMNERMTKATKQMKKCNNEFAATRKSVRELENYKEIDKFNSMQFERDLISASRIKYDDPAGLRAKLVYTDVNFNKTGY